MTIQAQLADGRTLEFPDGTDPSVIQNTVRNTIQSSSAGPASFSPEQVGLVQPVVQEGASLKELVTGESRQTDLTRSLPELEGILAGEDASVVARIFPLLATTTDQMELAQIIQNISPNIEAVFNKDAQGNTFPVLFNRKTGAAAQINRPGLSRTDIGQAIGLGAAFTPAGRGASLPLMGVRGAATQGVLEAAQTAEGGEFNLEDIALAGAALPAGQLASERLLKPAAKSFIDPSRKAIENIQSKKLLSEAAPSVEALRDTAKELYKQVDDIGARVKAERITSLSNQLEAQAKAFGFNRRIHPKVSAALDEVSKNVGKNIDVSEVETLRRVMQAAASSAEQSEKALGTKLIGTIDDFVGGLDEKSVIAGPRASEVGPLLKDARSLWGRARRTDLINESFEKAELQASGFENGIRVQFRSLLNNKKKIRGFSNEEKSIMREVVKGGKLENTAKLLGKLGMSEQQASRLLIPGLGVAAGAQLGGPLGAVAVPVIGQVSRNLAQRLTRKNAEFANAVVRSGKDSQSITRAYMKHTPKKQRSAEELSELFLSRGDIEFIDLEPMIKSSNKLISNGAFIASSIIQSRRGAEDILSSEESSAASEGFRP